MISQNGIKFIKGFEGCKLHPYLDSSKVPTIGWGMTYYPDTGKKVTLQDNTLTQQQADNYFIQMVKPYNDAIINSCTIFLNQNQIDALTSFAYNCGINAFKQSVLLQHVNKNKVTESDFTVYDHSNGQVLVGLLNRRKAEYALFINNDGIPTGSYTVTINKPMEKDTLQVLKINSITVNYDQIVNGETVNAGHSVAVTVTPELLAALKLANAGLCEEGYNIELTA